MPVYRLLEQHVFPPVERSEPDGLLAVGGDLSEGRLLLAYASGIFPWFGEGDPILWWAPDPRAILRPEEVNISRSLAKVLRRREFSVTYDRAFLEVIDGCAGVRTQTGEGTWITEELRSAYCRLHELGYAHSVECWKEGELVGGLYGLSLGRCFFGESMFHRVTNASKVAFVSLAAELAKLGFEMLDCQMPTDHLASLGAKTVSREEYMRRLSKGGGDEIGPPSKGLFLG